MSQGRVSGWAGGRTSPGTCSEQTPGALLPRPTPSLQPDGHGWSAGLAGLRVRLCAGGGWGGSAEPRTCCPDARAQVGPAPLGVAPALAVALLPPVPLAPGHSSALFSRSTAPRSSASMGWGHRDVRGITSHPTVDVSGVRAWAAGGLHRGWGGRLWFFQGRRPMAPGGGEGGDEECGAAARSAPVVRTSPRGLSGRAIFPVLPSGGGVPAGRAGGCSVEVNVQPGRGSPASFPTSIY